MPTPYPSLGIPSSDRKGGFLSGQEMALRFVVFLMPLLLAIELNALGVIYLAEPIAMGLLPFLIIIRGRLLQAPVFALLFGLFLFYFGAQVATDLIRESPFSHYARGWSRILFLLFCFTSIYLLIANVPARMVTFAIGWAMGGMLYELLTEPFAEIGWKGGYAGPSTSLFLLGFAFVPALRNPNGLLGPALIVLMAGLSVALDFRSWGGILLLTAAFIAMPACLRRLGLRPKPLSYGRLAFVGAVLLMAGFGGLKLYGHAASQGWLGEKSKQKYETQSALGDLGIIVGGRNETLVTVQAITDSPIIGHGSWAEDRYYAELKQLLLYRLGFVNRYIEPETDMIPTHSHLLGAWVEAGIGGAIFWFSVLGLIVAGLRRLYTSDHPLRPYFIFLLFLFVWDILFSPFGAQRRFTNGYLLVVLLYTLRIPLPVMRRKVAPVMSFFSQTQPSLAMPSGLAEPDWQSWPKAPFPKQTDVDVKGEYDGQRTEHVKR